MAAQTLVSAQAEDVTSSAVELGSPLTEDEILTRALQVDGTFGGTTATVQISIDGTNFTAVDGAGSAHFSCTAAAYHVIQTPGRVWVRLVTTGGTSASVNLKSN